MNTHDVFFLGEAEDSREITTTGYLRNFITRRCGRVRTSVTVEGAFDSPISVVAQPVLPALNISRASFGHPTDLHKLFDVTDGIGILCIRQGGNTLKVPRSFDLVKAFGEPCPGVRKMLKVNYDIRGMAGRLNFAEKNGKVAGRIQLGYPPDAKDRGLIGIPGFVERSCSTKSSRRGLHSHERNKLRSQGSIGSRGISRGNLMSPSRPN